MAFETLALDVPQPIAVVSITRQGTALALRLVETLPGCTVYVPARHGFALAMGAEPYDRLRDLFPKLWRKYRAMVCIMAAGIVVRSIAPLLRSKTSDPAVVVVDERGQYVISLLSGHVGGANRMAQVVASLLGAQAVITTGSDVAQKTALDTMALARDLVMEDMTWAARVTTAIVDEEPFWIYDPDGHLAPYRAMLSNALWVAEAVPATASGVQEFQKAQEGRQTALDAAGMDPSKIAGVWVSVSQKPKAYRAVVLRPRTLVVGVGCNRNTPAGEILQVVRDVMHRHHLAETAVRTLASVDIKENEEGLLEAARAWPCPIVFFSKETLQTQMVPNPSSVVHRHIGVYSVCEAAALQAARNGRLIVQKQKTPNVTVAVAKDGSGS
ncbi:MAG: cobalt-precorrin 5A hydrolase [Desulfosoma sp.]|uniref:cobalt-precorrin 5A hydrolase n=1 Tax=Desulfosoma sp. TaxID=2603217 RepID=UPI00404900A4